MTVEEPGRTQLEDFRPHEDICAFCRHRFIEHGWVLLCDRCQNNLETIYNIEVTEIESDKGQVYRVDV